MPDLTEEQRAELTKLTHIHPGAIGYVQERAQTRTPTLAQLADILLDDEAGTGLVAPGMAENGGALRDDCRETLEFIRDDPALRCLRLVEYRLGWGGDGLAGIVLEDEDGERCHFERNGLVQDEVGYTQGISADRMRAAKKTGIRTALWICIALSIIAAAIAYKVSEDRRIWTAELRGEFKAHLQEKYAGTYYDGEFIVDDKLARGVSAFGIRYGAKAYREDRPDLPFYVHTAERNGEGYITDDFFTVYREWEGSHAMADIIERIFGKEVLYSSGVHWEYGIDEDKLLKRNGYADMVNHYAEDNTYPAIYIIVFTETFDEEEACADIIELYNAFVANKSEGKFLIDISYTSSDDTERGINVDSGWYYFHERYYNPDDYLASVYLSNNAERKDDWRNQYPSLAVFIKHELKKNREALEERVRSGEFN